MARKTLQEHGKLSKPINLNNIAESLGARVYYKETPEGISGMIHKDGNHTMIAINEKESYQRQRFTLAHEIGHLVLHSEILDGPHIDGSFNQKLYRDGRSRGGHETIEREANRFAAELLMPEELIIESVKKLDFYFDPEQGAPDELAEEYGVSKQALTIRIMQFYAKSYFI